MSSNTTDRERVVAVFNEHWASYVMPIALLIILLIVSIMAFYIAGQSAYHQSDVATAAFLFALGFLLFVQHALFHLILSEYLSTIVVTTRRIMKFEKRLFLRDDIEEIPLDKMRSVRATKHGLAQLILGYGNLIFDPKEVITYVPHPHRVAKQIMSALGMD